MAAVPVRRRPTHWPKTSAARALLRAWLQVVGSWPGASWRILTLAGTPLTPLVALSLPGGRRRALLVAGLHGDEPAGPRALLRFFSAEAAVLRKGWTFDVLPLVNPIGYDAGTRGRMGCPDLNRAFGNPPTCPETAAIMRKLVKRGPSDSTVAAPMWDLVLSLHEDRDERCLYLYDSGYWERHALPIALGQSAAFLDWAETHAMPVCRQPFLDGEPNRGGVLIGGQTAFPAFEPVLFRSGVARRVVILETPGRQPLAARERAHLAALRHFLANEVHVPAPGKGHQ
jgi:protein MpaA